MDDAPNESATADGATEGSATQPVAVWAPAPPRKRHLGLWIGTPLAVALVGVVAASLVLIAPGTAVAGVQVGGMTAGAAADAIQAQLDRTAITLTGDGVDATLTGAQLGAKVDAKSLAASAFNEHPMWNLGSWFTGTSHATVSLEEATATAALHKVAGSLYQDATDATVRFDAASGTYVTTDAADGRGVDLKTLAVSMQNAFAAGESRVSVRAAAVPVAPAVTAATATKTAATLNTMLSTAGFYVGDERTVPVAPDVVASWLTVTPKGDAFAVTADAAAIQKTVDTLPAAVNRAPQNGTNITDLQGKVLRVQSAGVDGRTLGATDGIAQAYATALAKGDGVFHLDVQTTAPGMTNLARSIVVSLSAQKTYLYENGTLVDTYLISSGKADSPTHTGHFRITSKLLTQDMGCYPGAPYCTKNVPWVSYFNGDEAFHGTYWHHNFGHVMSHGCVNMPIDVAKFVYDWAPIGTPVTVQN